MSIQIITHMNVNINLNNVAIGDVATFVAAAMQHKGQYGVQLVTITDEHRLQKKNFAALIGKKAEVKKISEVSNALFGWDYERVVKSRIDRAGGDPNTFESVAPSGKNWVNGLYGIALYAEKTPGVYYLRSYQSKATRFRSCYLIDGRLASANEEAMIRQCLRDVSNSVKQMASGVDEEDQVLPRDYTLSNIYGLFNPAWNICFGQTYDQLIQSL